MNMNENLRLAAKEFTEKANKLSSVIEIAIVGSVAGGDPYPNDLDLAVVIRSFDDFEILAKYARQISKYYHAWEVFLFNEDLKQLGRVCYRKNCPTMSVDCLVPGCGNPPHLSVEPDFEYDERMFFESPIDVLWTSLSKSCLLLHKEELGIFESRKYPVLEDIEIECILCGKTFVFSANEQKWYQKRGLRQPKRCPDCKEKQLLDEFNLLEY